MLITRCNAKSMVAITLSVLLMAISLSCQNETKKRSDRVSLSEAFLLSNKHQARYDLVSDSLYEKGAISSVMRDFLEMQSNAPIGLFPGLEYEGEEIETVKGRALFIYTDGLNEAEDPEQRQFGDERLLDILRNTHFDTAQQVIETLAADVAAHRQGAEPNDDLTMMCLRVS